ncbi:MDR family MFS transporter [Alicyclobacillus contaminans]|uniref:MDR family MFS transporter n=1 Tax=Alicyclobacillus contaminans TaxID=392016 RepID=UPI00041CDF8E|nr:MDR family MFS transporter [Alicyclobacillus contaminans]
MERTTNRRLVTLGMLVAILLVAIDVTVVGTAMPKIVADLGGLESFSWVFAIYTLTTSVTTPIYGKLADLYGRKVIFTVGVILFLIGSALSGLSHSMSQLIWFRGLQGIGAGAVMPLTFTIIGDLFPGEQRARMQGLFSSIWGIAGLLGPLVGGFFVDNVTWQWIFYINIPVGIVSLVLVWVALHEKFEKKARRHIDVGGALTFTIGVSALLYALLNGGQKYAWDSAAIIGLFVLAVLALALFVWIEARVQEPMLPLFLFKHRVILMSNLVGFLTSCVLIGLTAYLPYWIQDIIGFSATSSGLTLMPLSIAWPIGATLAGRYMYRVGSKLTAVAGTLLITAGAIWLACITLVSPAWMFVAVMVLSGLGMGYATTPITVLIQSAVGWNLRGAATASSTFVRSLGQTVGIAILGTMFNQSLASYAKAHLQHQNGIPQGDVSTVLQPAAVQRLPQNVQNLLHQVLAHGLHTVFVAMLVGAILSVVAVAFMPLHRTIMKQQVQE